MRTNKYLKIDIQSELELYKFIEISNKPREKRRAMAILMSNDKKSVPQIAKKLNMNPDTVYDWLINFTNTGIDGIRDKLISGRPKKLKIQNEEVIKEVFKKSS
ncbi:MAG: helix-turn-helix domain-containing protein [Helicobacteraceae bacterium]|nr:helix-turn-helix domain-containing protein [Candidatus Sulfurimonas ponti]